MRLSETFSNASPRAATMAQELWQALEESGLSVTKITGTQDAGIELEISRGNAKCEVEVCRDESTNLGMWNVVSGQNLTIKKIFSTEEPWYRCLVSTIVRFFEDQA